MTWRRVFFPLLLGGLFSLGCGRLAAADKPAAAAEASGMIYPGTSGGRTEAAAGRGAGGYNTVLVAALLLGAAGTWLFWRGRKAPGGTASLRKLAIAETKSLGNRQYLVVASYAEKRYLLGVCPGRIELLTPLDENPPAGST